MKTKMWGYIAAAMLLALGLQSCQDIDSIPVGERYPILFGSYETRAVADLTTLQDEGFKVYAYFTGNTDNSATFDKEVTYDSAQDIWGYTGLEYWIPSTEYWFKAFYPKSGYFSVDNTSNAQNYTISGYNITDQVDLMVATATATVEDNATAPTTGSVVKLSFEHLLACVEIKMTSKISGVTINNITLNDIATNGTCANGTWTSSNQVNLTIDSGVTLEQNADAVDVTNGGILVIPVMTGSETLTIEASNKTYSNISFPENTSWQAGNKYTYTAEIKQNNIVFNEPTVDKWDSESAIGSVIIK